MSGMATLEDLLSRYPVLRPIAAEIFDVALSGVRSAVERGDYSALYDGGDSVAAAVARETASRAILSVSIEAREEFRNRLTAAAITAVHATATAVLIL